jgi:hypothetical protein
MVEDIEKVIDEVFKVRVKTEKTEGKIVQDTVNMQKQITDLEAHINTSIITEKSLRKSGDRNLAQELDAVLKVIKSLSRD